MPPKIKILSAKVSLKFSKLKTSCIVGEIENKGLVTYISGKYKEGTALLIVSPSLYLKKVSSGTRTINLRVRNSDKVKNWVGMINEAALRLPEGWCNPHRYGSFAPPRGLTDDGSHVQWFIDGEASFDAIATSIEEAKSEVCISNLQSMPFFVI